MKANYQDDLLYFICPGCNHRHYIYVGDDETTRPRWNFNGNLYKPTATPSILYTRHIWTPPVTPKNLEEYKKNPWPQKKKEHICHSYITDGMIQFLNDCTHDLAGKTVELPDIQEETE